MIFTLPLIDMGDQIFEKRGPLHLDLTSRFDRFDRFEDSLHRCVRTVPDELELHRFWGH